MKRNRETRKWGVADNPDFFEPRVQLRMWVCGGVAVWVRVWVTQGTPPYGPARGPDGRDMARDRAIDVQIARDTKSWLYLICQKEEIPQQ